MNSQRRCVIVPIGRMAVLDAFLTSVNNKKPMFYAIPECDPPVPPDAELLEVTHDPITARFLFKVAHPSFPEVPDGEPTPKASDAERGGRGDLLQVVRGNNSPTNRWRPPTVTDAVHPGRTKPSKPGKQISLPQQVNAVATTTGQLNPEWVEWLMGFPTGWTDLGDSETPSCPRSPSGSADA